MTTGAPPVTYGDDTLRYLRTASPEAVQQWVREQAAVIRDLNLPSSQRGWVIDEGPVPLELAPYWAVRRALRGRGRDEEVTKALDSLRHPAEEVPDGYGTAFVARCSICGRPLTNPRSLARGVGDECAGKVGVQ